MYKVQYIPTKKSDINIILSIPKSNFTEWGIERGENGFCRAWSLHRLIEMRPQGIQDCSYRCFVLAVNSEGVSYEHHYIDEEGQGYNDSIGCTDLFDNLYDNIIAHIEWLIKEGYFNKEYLEEQV